MQDYDDITNRTQLDAARQTLDTIKESAAAEEATGFDASGSSGGLLQYHGYEEAFLEENGSNGTKSQHEWQSITDDTSLSHGLSSLDLGTESDRDRDKPVRFGGLDEAEKEFLLAGIFPKMKLIDIKYALKRSKGVVELAMDELLTQSFLEENGGLPKGVDGFNDDNIGTSARSKRKRRKKNNKIDTSGGIMNEQEPERDARTSSKWDKGKDEIEFISSRTGLDFHRVSSLYYKNGASKRKTIYAIIEAHLKSEDELPDSLIERTLELSQEFPTVPIPELSTLIQLTRQSNEAAYELAKALTSHPTDDSKPGIQIEFRHPPLHLEDESPTVKLKSHNAVFVDGEINQFNASSAASRAAEYKDRRNVAFMQASAAFKKGKSDPLMGGAAAYYSQIARDLNVHAKNAESAAADALAAQQSTKNKLDLHGITVKDAIRITRERVTKWWHELEEVRADGRGVGPGYTIVTGIGQHSEGGRGKLGPAVGKMLIREGWKVEVSSGILVVTGRTVRR